LVRLQKEDVKVKKIRKEVEEGRRWNVQFLIKDNVLMKRFEVKGKIGHERVLVQQAVVPKNYQAELVRIAHEDRFAGHMGLNNTLRRLRMNFYWTGMREML